MRTAGSILKWFGLTLLLLLAITLIKTWLTPASQPERRASIQVANDTTALRHLAEAIRFRTISFDDSGVTTASLNALEQLYRWMETTYPGVAGTARFMRVGHNLLIRLPGKLADRPAIFLAHLDVVPAAGGWRREPFAGVISGDTLWGRGTLDDKNTAVALLEAMEGMIKSGFTPGHDIYLAFGHDEEIGGENGAKLLAEYFEKQKIKASFIADEGFGVMEGVVPGLKQPCAIIGLGEKGNLSLKLKVKIPGGHSAWPPVENASSVLTAALHRLDAYQFPAHIDGPVRQLFETAGPHMAFGYRWLFANLWLTSPLVKQVLLGGEKTAASIRTTHVSSVIRAGVKENVVPAEAEAIVNFRLRPGDSMAYIMRQVKEVIADERVTMEIYQDHHEATPVSPVDAAGYRLMAETITALFPEAVVTPGLVITGTDCKHYTRVSDCIYRFVPFTYSDANLGGIHGANEYITLKQLSVGIAFYKTLFARL